MRRGKVDEAVVHQAMERAWLLMAFISGALCDHPLIRSTRSYRRHTDRARKALFDLHSQLQRKLGTPPERKTSSTLSGPGGAEDDFGARLLKLKGSIPANVSLACDDDKRAARRRRRSRRK